MDFFASPAALAAFNEKVIQIYFWFFFFSFFWWPEPINMRDGYVFETRFSAGKI